MQARLLLAAALGASVLAGCSPSLDWRQVRPEGSTLEALFPCRPASQVRRLALAGVEAEMSLFACRADDTTFAVSFIDVTDPARVGVALAELRAAAQAHVRGEASRREPAAVPGMTPNVQAERLSLRGTLPDGRPVRQESSFFAHATRVYQASILGPEPKDEAVDAFFSGLRLSS